MFLAAQGVVNGSLGLTTVFFVYLFNDFEFGRNHDGGRCGDGEPTDIPTFVAVELFGIDIQRHETKSVRYGGAV